MYHPVVCYSSYSINKIMKTLELIKTPARPIMRYDNKSKKLIQTKMTLLILAPPDYTRLSKFFTKAEGGSIELGNYHIRPNKMPTGDQIGDLYLRFDPDCQFSHGKVQGLIQNWLLELQEKGVISSYELMIPLEDREGDGTHKGYGFVRFPPEQEMKGRCVVFAMLQNRRLDLEVNSKDYLSVVWSKRKNHNEEN